MRRLPHSQRKSVTMNAWDLDIPLGKQVELLRALAVYDGPRHGGNGDGIIDFRDAIFGSLRLWIDMNHDGVCQREELHTLTSLGVNPISLDYHLSERTDQYGNVFRYYARVNPDKSTDVGKIVDGVFFVTENPPDSSAMNREIQDMQRGPCA